MTRASRLSLILIRPRTCLQVYYVLAKDPDPYPPDFTNYINGIASKVGGQGTWQFSNDDVYSNFFATGRAFLIPCRSNTAYGLSTGDWMRNSRPDLETVINAGVRTIVFDGDAVSRSQVVVLSGFIFYPYYTGLYPQLLWRRSHGRGVEHPVLCQVCEENVYALYSGRPNSRTVQERWHFFVHPDLWGRSRSSGVYGSLG